jgi:hypothetical protein
MPFPPASLVVFALIVSCLTSGWPRALADELPADTNQIESLTPEAARKLAGEFPGVEVEVVVPRGTFPLPDCLPLNGLKALDAETAKALAGYGRGPLLLNGLTTLDAATATALVAIKNWNGQLPAFTAFDTPDSVAIAEALATRQGKLTFPNLQKISPKTLTALLTKNDVEIPLVETLEVIPEPDGSLTEDFLVPDWLEERQMQQAR